MQVLIIKAKPKFNEVKPPENKIRLKFYNFINHPLFDPVILTLIMINIVLMAIVYEGAT